MSEPPEEAPPAGEPAIRIVAMPSELNAAGDMFGGWLMSMMDLAAGTVAFDHAGRSATAAVDGMSFLRPVAVGDLMSVYAELVSVGRTSMRVAVQAWRRSGRGSGSQKVTEATFTFVALDDTGRPRPVPPMQESRDG